MVLIKTQRDTLLAPLQSVSGIVERRHTLPILSNVLLEKKGDRLTLLATDIEIQITTTTQGAGGDGDGAVTVGARKLQEILRSLPDTTEVSLLLEDKRLQVRGGKSRFSLQTLPADDFPRMAIATEEAQTLTVTQQQFRHLLGGDDSKVHNKIPSLQDDVLDEQRNTAVLGVEKFHRRILREDLGRDLYLDAAGGVDAAALHPADAGGGDRDEIGRAHV